MTADTRYVTTILCDELGCKRRFREPADSGATRILAAAEGWSYVVTSRVRDLCPDHTRTGETDG